MTNAGGLPVLAVLGPHNSLDYYWSDNNGWHREQVAGPGSAYSAPAMSEGNSTFQIAVEGPNHSLDFYWQAFNTSGWNENVLGSAGTTYSQPAIANWECVGLACFPTTIGGTNIYAEGPGNSMSEWFSQWGGSWDQIQAAGPKTTYSAPALDEVGDGATYDSHLAYRGPNNSLQFQWATPGDNGSETIAGNNTTYSAPTIAAGNNAIAVSAQGARNSLDFYWQTNDTSSWNIESVAGNGSTYGAPSLGEGNNSTDISAQGSNNSLDYYWQTYGGGNWNPETPGGSGSTFR